jgi:hypothetical protein
MQYSVNVDHNSMAAHLTRSDSEGFLRSTVCPMQWTGLMMIYCGMAGKRVGSRGVSVRKMKALTVKIEIATLFGKRLIESDMLCVLSA